MQAIEPNWVSLFGSRRSRTHRHRLLACRRRHVSAAVASASGAIERGDVLVVGNGVLLFALWSAPHFTVLPSSGRAR